MSDVPPSGASSQTFLVPVRQPFPVARMFYAIGFAFVAWVVLWFVFVIGVVQFAVLAVNGRVNDELKGFSLSLVQYLWELLAFVTFVRDERPFHSRRSKAQLRREIAPDSSRDACKILRKNNVLRKRFRRGSNVAEARRIACFTVAYWVQSFREIAPPVGRRIISLPAY